MVDIESAASHTNDVPREKRFLDSRNLLSVERLLWALLVVGLLAFLATFLIAEDSSPKAFKVCSFVATTLVPTVLIGLMIDHSSLRPLGRKIDEQLTRSHKSLDDKVENRLRELKEQLADQHLLTEVNGVFGERTKIVRELFEGATKDIDILTTCLSSLSNILHILVDRAENHGVNVRILTLDPNHSFTSDRVKDFASSKHESKIEYTPEDFKAEMIQSLKEFARRSMDVPRRERQPALPGIGEEEGNADGRVREGSINVRVHSRFPTKMIFRADEEVIIGFILHHQDFVRARGRYHIHLKFDTSGKLGRDRSKCFIEHFEVLWKDATKVDKSTIVAIESGTIDVTSGTFTDNRSSD